MKVHRNAEEDAKQSSKKADETASAVSVESTENDSSSSSSSIIIIIIIIRDAKPMDVDSEPSAGFGLPPNFKGHYELFAMVTHVGRSADSGHYKGWAKQDGTDDAWACFDDDEVDPCKLSDILLMKGGGDSDMAYLAFYRAI